MRANGFVVCLWLGSTLPIGIALWALPPAGRMALWAVAIVLDHAHRLSPIVTSWTHREFRGVMLVTPWKTIGLPLLLLALASSVGVATSLGLTSFVFAPGRQWIVTDLSNPFPILVWAYTVWNFYHFGMQNFGIVSLLRGRRSRWQRTCDMSWTCGGTFAAMMLTPGMIEFNHWIVELGLCGKVSRRSFILIGTMLAFGALYLLWWVPTPKGMAWTVSPIGTGMMCVMTGLGFWHFLQDRWMWKLSDPQVRATIGAELFR